MKYSSSRVPESIWDRFPGWLQWWKNRLLADGTGLPGGDELQGEALGYSLQEAFQLHTQRSILLGVRMATLFALVLFPAFAFLDKVFVPPSAYHQVITIRFTAELSFFAVFLVSYLPGWKRRALGLGLLAAYSGAGSIVWMTLLWDLGSNSYYAGVNLVMLGMIIIPWGGRPTALMALIIWGSYLVSHLVLHFAFGMPMKGLHFVSNNFFMFTTGIITTGANWYKFNLEYEAYRARFNQNRAYSELHLANEQLNRQNREVRARTEELAEANRLLGEKRKELEETNQVLAEQYRVKSQFLDNMSHELRTPLTCIITPLDALITRDLPEALGRLMNGMHQSAHQLLDLINDLLDVSRYENNRVPFHPQRTDPREYVERLVTGFEFNARNKGIELRLEAEDGLPPVWLDRKEGGKVVRNLLSNAIKFTPPGGLIRVRLEVVDEMLLLAVTDTGPGIAPEKIPLLFRPFAQVDSSHTRAYEGAGLGLSILKHIVELHGGQVGIDSELGKGTTVWARFPLTPREEEEEPDVAMSIRPVEAPQQLELTDRLLVGLRDEVVGPDLMDASLSQASPFSGPRGKLMVVEDNAQLRELVASFLSHQYDVCTAADGQEGLELALQVVPDLIVSDVMMPRMSGLQLLEKVRSTPSLSRTPFILLTAKAEGPDRVRGLWSGANDYLTKPFIPQELLARVHNLLRVKEFESYLSRLNQDLAGRSDSLEDKLHRLFVNTVKTLVAAIDSKDEYTGGHSERVAYFACILGEAAGLSTAQLQTLELGALLHDVGKIGVPDSILNKPGKLSPEEVLIIRKHAQHSGAILGKAPELAELRQIAMHHHERWDGQGYPSQLKGEEIPFLARVVNMADTWDAMVSDRIYRPGMTPEDALARVQREVNTQFDPLMVSILEKVWERLVPPPELKPLRRQPRDGQGYSQVSQGW